MKSQKAKTEKTDTGTTPDPESELPTAPVQTDQGRSDHIAVMQNAEGDVKEVTNTIENIAPLMRQGYRQVREPKEKN